MEQSWGDETSSRGRSAGIGQSRVGGGRASDQSQLLYCVVYCKPTKSIVYFFFLEMTVTTESGPLGFRKVHL